MVCDTGSLIEHYLNKNFDQDMLLKPDLLYYLLKNNYEVMCGQMAKNKENSTIYLQKKDFRCSIELDTTRKTPSNSKNNKSIQKHYIVREDGINWDNNSLLHGFRIYKVIDINDNGFEINIGVFAGQNPIYDASLFCYEGKVAGIIYFKHHKKRLDFPELNSLYNDIKENNLLLIFAMNSLIRELSTYIKETKVKNLKL
jgi:hypothetical protein